MDLESEVIKLKAENEKLTSLLVDSNSCSKNEDTAAISIHFKNQGYYNLHRHKLKRLFEKFVDYEVVADDSKFEITVTENDCIIIEDGEVVEHSVSKKRKSNNNGEEENKKRKKIAIQPEEDDFVLDTTPSFNTDSNLKYESKFSTTKSDESLEEKLNLKEKPSNNCFNCGENHILRECPKPRNGFKINAARQAMKKDRPTRNVRYHVENDEFAHLKAGNISKSLRSALQVSRNELPEYIYRMRQLGYPPGWLEEVSHSEADLVVFGFDGETESTKQKAVKEFDADLIIEYPGFNVPMGSMVKDNYKYFGCHSFSIAQSKTNMIAQLNMMNTIVADNSEVCDMDFNTSSDDEEEKEVRCVSPTLLKLKLQRKKLIDQLNMDKNSPDMEESVEDNSHESVENCFLTNNNVEEIDPKIDVPEKQITASAFGTPILGSMSAYSKLPGIENFAKDVAPLLLVENLLESKGKFVQLNAILDKVRKFKGNTL